MEVWSFTMKMENGVGSNLERIVTQLPSSIKPTITKPNVINTPQPNQFGSPW